MGCASTDAVHVTEFVTQSTSLTLVRAVYQMHNWNAPFAGAP